MKRVMMISMLCIFCSSFAGVGDAFATFGSSTRNNNTNVAVAKGGNANSNASARVKNRNTNVNVAANRNINRNNLHNNIRNTNHNKNINNNSNRQGQLQGQLQGQHQGQGQGQSQSTDVSNSANNNGVTVDGDDIKSLYQHLATSPGKDEFQAGSAVFGGVTLSADSDAQNIRAGLATLSVLAHNNVGSAEARDAAADELIEELVHVSKQDRCLGMRQGRKRSALNLFKLG